MRYAIASLLLLAVSGCTVVWGVLEDYRVRVVADPGTTQEQTLLDGATNTRYYTLEHSGRVHFTVTRLSDMTLLVDYKAESAGKRAWRRDGTKWVDVDWAVAAEILKLNPPG